MTSRTACICGAPLARRDFSESFDAWCCVACRSCHFVRRGSAPNRSFDYNEANAKYCDPAYLQGKQLRWSHRTLLAADWRGRRVLEIGCFNGFFLDELHKAGADVWGFDVNATAVAVGSALFGLGGRLFTDLDTTLANGPFDDVLCIDVLEHLDHPEDLVARLQASLGPEGRLVVAGPTLERGFHDKSDFPPHHKWWFSRTGLVALANGAGLGVERTYVQRDGLLLLRNVIGRLLSKGPRREFYGDGGALSPDTSRGWVGRLYAAGTWVGSVLLALTGRTYCSTVLVTRRAAAR